MRLVIDSQGAQSESRVRGIGRYSLALIRAIVRNRGQHEIVLALNGAFPETIDEIRDEFEGTLGAENIRVWDYLPDTAGNKPHPWRARAMEQVREYFLQSLRPDVLLVTSLFDGYGDDVVSSVGSVATTATAVVLYDLIPLVFRDAYLPNASQEAWYFRKLDHLMRSDLLLGISQSACDDAHELLGADPSRLVNIGGAADDVFRRLADPHALKPQLEAMGIDRPYVMCTGGIEPRKNLRRAIQAFAQLPKDVREGHLFVIVWQATDNTRAKIQEWAAESGVSQQVVLTGYVTDETLVALYNGCKVFIAPSVYEGFGLPALEAMQCGAAVIASNTSSFPEVIGIDEALFDPSSVESIEQALERALTEDDFRERLRSLGSKRPDQFTWDRTALTTMGALEKLAADRPAPTLKDPARSASRQRLALVLTQTDSREALRVERKLMVSELARLYDVTLVTSPGLDSGHLPASLPRRSRSWLRRNSLLFDRVLYDVAPSACSPDILALLRDVPGVVLLRDRFSHSSIRPSARMLTRMTYDSHGYLALANSPRLHDIEDLTILSIVSYAIGVITHSEDFRTAANKQVGEARLPKWTIVPHIQASPGLKLAPGVMTDEMLPRRWVELVVEFIEGTYENNVSGLTIARSIARIDERATPSEVAALADVVVRTFPSPSLLQQLLVDVSELARRDAATGIQRVVKQVLSELLRSPPSGYRVEPVYFDGTAYRYARSFTTRFFSLPPIGADEVVDFRRGDLFLGLDLDLLAIPKNAALYRRLRSIGVSIWFVVYDILCVRLPQHFVGPMERYFTEWLPVIGLADGLACISQAVADDVDLWYEENPAPSGRTPRTGVFHLGADFSQHGPPTTPEWRSSLTARLGGRKTFLMVGTLESRKGYRQTLDAFELLWKEDVQVNLVIVGKAGWLVDDVLERLRQHRELNSRLFWFEGPSDNELVHLYRESTCLLAASEGEGFGLPLVEASHYELPILARDLPVFKEVAGSHAIYFSGYLPSDIADAVTAWLALDVRGIVPPSKGIEALSWSESAQDLVRLITGKDG